MPIRKLLGHVSTASIVTLIAFGCGGGGTDAEDTSSRDGGWEPRGDDAGDDDVVGDGATPDGGDGATSDGGSPYSDVIACDVGALGKGDRVVVVKNQCAGQTVTVGVNGGFVTDCGPGRTCPTGSTCSDARVPAGCFWDFPSPKCGSGVLAPGASATYVLDAPPRPVGPPGSQVTVKWSGNVYASTDCDANGKNCKTAQCAASIDGKTVVGSCSSGTGPQGPATLAEFTFVPAGKDYYDISAINGVNVPVMMRPLASKGEAGDPYSCQAAGATRASGTGLSACSWDFDPTIRLTTGPSDQKTLLRAVTSGGKACNVDADCGSGDLCGTAIAFGATTITRSCGAPIGWWTGNEICVYSNNAYGGALDCKGPVPGQGERKDLYECAGANPNSCYSNTTATATCCGCPDWTLGGAKLPLAPGFQCYATNPQWTAVAEPWAEFTKKACPTAYSFPFDDPTSTFTCTTPSPTSENPNSTNYEIVFCPDGKDAR